VRRDFLALYFVFDLDTMLARSPQSGRPKFGDFGNTGENACHTW
jgi:hypothetical protein